MAEFLVYNTNHWMDSVPAKKREKWNDNMLAKYYARYQKGDIIEIYSDGMCTERPSPNSKFIIVKVKDLLFEDTIHLTDAITETVTVPISVKNPNGGDDIIEFNEVTTILKRRRYRMTSDITDIPTEIKIVLLSKFTFAYSVLDKASG